MKTLAYFYQKEREIKEKGGKVIGLTLTSPTFPSPPLKKRVLRLLPHSFSYSLSGGNLNLRETLANFYSKKWNIKLSKENVFIGNGGKEILFILLNLILKDGGEVIIISPYWSSYPRIVKRTKGNFKIFKTLEKDNFYPNVESLAKEINKKTKAIIINTPNNPTGKILREKDIKFLVEIVKKKNILLISDEVYEIYDFEGLYCSFLKYFSKNIFCVFSASKIFSMCGWRLGWCFGDPKLIEEMKDYQADLSTSPHTLSQLVVNEILNDKNLQKYLEKNRELAKERRDIAVDFFSKKRIDFIFPEGGIALFVKIPQRFRKASQFAKILLEREKVSVAPGEIFGEEKFFRINLAVNIEDLKEGLRRIAKFY
jgi:aspartate aminotransferase